MGASRATPLSHSPFHRSHPQHSPSATLPLPHAHRLLANLCVPQLPFPTPTFGAPVGTAGVPAKTVISRPRFSTENRGLGHACQPVRLEPSGGGGGWNRFSANSFKPCKLASTAYMLFFSPNVLRLQREGGGGSGVFLAMQACFKAYMIFFTNPSCEHCVCRWGSPPQKTN